MHRPGLGMVVVVIVILFPTSNHVVSCRHYLRDVKLRQIVTRSPFHSSSYANFTDHFDLVRILDDIRTSGVCAGADSLNRLRFH